jgi:hypothetical protein
VIIYTRAGTRPQELGFEDDLPTDDALEESVRWLIDHAPEPGGEIENQVGDPFDYESEDAIIQVSSRLTHEVANIPYALPGYSDQYRHPRQPGEWRCQPELAPL